jgi:hypothetical protein
MAKDVMRERKEIMAAVKRGNATIGSIYQEFEIEGLDNVTRHMRHGYYSVPGVTIPPGKNDHAVDRMWAEKLLKMKHKTPIVWHSDPRRGNAKPAANNNRLKRTGIATEQNSTDELPDDEEFFDGAVSKVLVNRYERDPNARAACLQKLGCTCSVCDFDFGKAYGKIGAGFIHVHHRKPLALRKAEYRVNPTKDLTPVCPNCHAMLHRDRPWDDPLSTDELRKIIRNHGNI